MRASYSRAPPLCAVNCSSHSRNKALRVLCCDLAKRRACSMSCSSALSVIFFFEDSVHENRVKRYWATPGDCANFVSIT